jgi:hypothetical protein
MSFSYCPHCAAKNEYTLEKPKVCASCGKAIGVVVAKASGSNQVTANQQFGNNPYLGSNQSYTTNQNSSYNNASYNNRPKSIIRPNKMKDENGNFVNASSEDAYCEDDVAMLKNQIIASIGGEIKISVDKNDDIIKFGNLIGRG